MKKVIVRRVVTPAGAMMVGAIGERLCLCEWDTPRRREDARRALRHYLEAEAVETGPAPESKVICQAVNELKEFFEGRRRELGVPLLTVGTEFQREVWRELQGIPYGTTTSYGEIARRIGRPKSVRAVANAIGSNLISIFIPCHRVVGSDGRLTGYAGGLDAKRVLLDIERSEGQLPGMQLSRL